MPVQHRANNFDGVRLLAAVMVLSSHQYALAGRTEPMVVGLHSLGNIGLLTFFSISGYLVTRSWAADPNPLRFLLRRFLRIWPGLAVATLIVAILTWARAGQISKPLSLLSPLWFQVRGSAAANLNGSLWTIPYEVGCYLILLAVGFAARRHLDKAIIALVMVSTLWYFLLVGGQHGFNDLVATGQLRFLPYLGAFFWVGAVFAVLPKLLAHVRSLWLAAFVMFISGQILIGLLLSVPVTALVVGNAEWPVVRSAGRWGDLSYGTYLYAWPVQLTVIAALGNTAAMPLLIACSLLGALGLAVMSWHSIERPALRLKPGRRYKP